MATAGAAGAAGTAGTGGSPSTTIIPVLDVCSELQGLRLCADFEKPLTSPDWPQGSSSHVMERDDAPSGGHVLETPSAPIRLGASLEHPYTISMWVRIPSSVQQPLISLKTSDGFDTIGLGIGHGRLRWIHSGAPDVFAPSNELVSAEVPPRTWVCVEVLVETPNTLFGRVVVPGGLDLLLPVLDVTPTAGNDDAWNEAIGTVWRADGGLSIGNEIAGVLIDDVLVSDPSTLSVCDRFLQATAK